MRSRPRILLVNSDEKTSRELVPILSRCEGQPVVLRSLREAQAALKHERISMVFCNALLPDGDFRGLLKAAAVGHRNVPVVVTTRVGDTREYLEAMALGAFDYIACPYSAAEVERIMGLAMPKAVAA